MTMVSEAQSNPEKLVEKLLQLGRLAQSNPSRRDGEELSSAQWTVLRYLDSANAASRTPSGFAKFHGTTRGTASQTIRGLIRQGYLRQSPAEGDGRSKRLDLTAKAKAVQPHDPLEAVVRAADNLPRAVRGQFIDTLETMLDHVAREKGARPFGTCDKCNHMICVDQRGDPADGYACAIMQSPLAADDLARLCVNFQQLDAPTPPHAAT